MKKVSHRIVREREGAAALIIVLAFVVLLTAIVVASFSRSSTNRQVSSSSATQNSADLLARGALAITVADLKQEITAGSTPTTVSNTTIYTPNALASPAAITPYLVGSTGTGGLENLVKRSANGVAFYPFTSNYNTSNYPPANRAAGPSSQSSTTVASLNGRLVSATRWNKPLLLMKKTLTSTDVTPVAAFTPPDWVLVARDGSNPTSWNSNMITSPSNSTSIVGRYAYNIYDEGGLIDMNVAGFPTISTTTQVGRKGQVAYAELTSIPGVSPSPPATGLSALSQTKFRDDIVGWRNFASAGATGQLGTFASGTIYNFASGTNYYNSILTPGNGFIAVNSNTLNSGQSDRKFASRQALISLLTQGMAGTSASDIANLQVALQYFGTFSRELNRPSWKPITPSAINADLNSVRVGAVFTRSDGTQSVLGEPIMKERFAMTRLNGLSSSGIVTTINSTWKYDAASQSYKYLPADATTVQRDFGLHWNGVGWDYYGSTGSIVVPSIKTLSQVALENREPNFFEVLKAVILNGSVGLGSGAGGVATFVMAENKYWDTSAGLSADYQIMQIGANIIDAWDADNIPTWVNFNGNELAGVENLPYLSKLVFDFWVSKNGNGGAHDQMYSWLVPSLWNPHQNASAAPIPPAGPDVRFIMTSGSVHSVATFSDWVPAFSTGATPVASPYPSMEVKASGFVTACPPVPNPASSPLPNNENGAMHGNAGTGGGTVNPTNPPRDVIGYYDGIDLGNPTDLYRNNAYKKVLQIYPIFGPNTTFEMQVNTGTSASPVWKMYQTWKNCYNGTDPPNIINPPSTALVANQGASYGNSSFHDPEFVSLDPRTVRFGVWGSQASDYKNSNDLNYNGGAEDTMDQRTTSGALEGIASTIRPQPASAFPMNAPSGKNYLQAYFYAANSSAQPNNLYKDLDGVPRRADWTTTTAGTTTTKTIMYASASPSPTPLPTPVNSQDRPRILSAPFQSVAELGHVFRDQPWKTLSFSTANSADAGLLDVFTLQDTSIVAGRTSLNTKQSAVLTAILREAIRNIADGLVVGEVPATNSEIQPADYALIASRLSVLNSANPMINKSQLITTLMEDATLTSLWNQSSTKPWNKESRETVIRAFGDSTQTRTWNLMIDVIAQSGRYPANATTPANFIVEGEKRYWLHVAIDRFTGEVIDQQLEAVYE